MTSRELLMHNIFCFDQQFDLEQDWRSVPNPKLDWSLNPFGDNEWTFMLNRMEYIQLLDPNIPEQGEKIRALILNWIANVDLKSDFVRTIDTAIRLSAWLPFISTFNNQERELVIKSMMQQVEYLEENWLDRHLVLNWGIIQTCSLIQLADELDEIEIEDNLHKERLETMLEYQFSKTGFHNECSTLYLFEVIKQLNKVNQIHGYEFVNKTLTKAKATIVNLRLNNGELVAIGDSDCFVADEVYKHLDIDPTIIADNTLDGVVHLHNGKFEVMLFNMAHGGGHGHFMSNHIELCIEDQHVLIDCGRYTYLDTEPRMKLKSYPSHNTVELVEQPNFPLNSWKNMGRLQPFPIERYKVEDDNLIISSWFNGQEVVNRCLWLQKDKVIIIDYVKSKYSQTFNFHEDIQVVDNMFTINESNYYINCTQSYKLTDGVRSKTYNKQSSIQKIMTAPATGFQVTCISSGEQALEINSIFNVKEVVVDNYRAISIDNKTLLLSFEENLEVSIPYYFKNIAFNCRLGLVLDGQLKVLKT